MVAHRLLVYGNLLPGLRHHALIERSRLLQRSARTRHATFLLLDSGIGFPFALSLPRQSCDEHGVRLLGAVYEVDDPTLRELDELEEHLQWFSRREVQIEGDEAPAWLYLLHCSETAMKEIASSHCFPRVKPVGDWRGYLERRKSGEEQHTWPLGATRMSEGPGGKSLFCWSGL